jgi:hypothetical protein
VRSTGKALRSFRDGPRVDIYEGYRKPVRGQPPRDPGSDATAGARDQGDPWARRLSRFCCHRQEHSRCSMG